MHPRCLWVQRSTPDETEHPPSSFRPARVRLLDTSRASLSHATRMCPLGATGGAPEPLTGELQESSLSLHSPQSHQSLIPMFLRSCPLASLSAAANLGLSETSRRESKSSGGNRVLNSSFKASFRGGNPGPCESCNEVSFRHFPHYDLSKGATPAPP